MASIFSWRMSGDPERVRRRYEVNSSGSGNNEFLEVN